MTPITTEARIYAKNVMREIKRREKEGAATFHNGSETWADATAKLFVRIAKNKPHDPLTLHAFHNTRKRLEAIPFEERGFYLNPRPDPDAIELLTFSAGGHTLTVMEDLEEGVYVQSHYLSVSNKTEYIHTGIVSANISTHVFGRLYDRTTPKPDVLSGIYATVACAKLGRYAQTDRVLAGISRSTPSELNLYFTYDVMLTGSIKVSTHADGKNASPWFDVRTALPIEACTEEQLAQAKAIDDFFSSSGRKANIPYIPRRTDFVLDTIEASKRKPH